MAKNRKRRTSTTVPITPSVLKWAMAEGGFTVETLAEKLKKLKVTTDTIRAWLADEAHPTLPAFRKLAATLARIPSVFFLPDAPPSPAPAVEFRHPPGGRASLNPTERRYIREAARVQKTATWLMRELGTHASSNPRWLRCGGGGSTDQEPPHW